MGAARDITNEFKTRIRAVAVKQGLDEATIMKLTSSLIMPKAVGRSAFTSAGIEIMRSINTLHMFIVTHHKDYTDRHRSTEQDRDSIEHEVGMFVKTCRERVEILKNTIGRDETGGQSKWLGGLIGISSNADLVAHQHGVVLILSERLHSVTAYFDGLRAVRFQEAIEKTTPRWRKGMVAQRTNEKGADIVEATRQERQPELESKHQLLDDETHALQVELTNLLDSAQETERKMIEMSALNHLFSTHVLQQAQQIEILYQQAVAATENVDKGNKEIRKAIDRSNSSRTFLILFFIVFPLTLLFLHWYN